MQFIAVQSSASGAFQRLNDCIVKIGAQLLDGLIAAVGPGAVGEQGYRQLAVWVDPQRGSGVAEMAKRIAREVFSGL